MLMMGGNKKRLATMIVGKMGEKSPDYVDKMGKGMDKEVDMNEPESDSDAGFHAAASELISAVHAKDEKAVHRALVNHYKMTSVADNYQAQDTAGNESNRQNFND